MEKVKASMGLASGAVGGGIASVFGGWDSGLKVLIAIMALDYVTGLIVAGVFQKSTKTESGALKSIEGWKGLCRKGMTLAIVFLAYQLDIVAGTDFIRTATVIAYITIESLSIIENAGQMGVPIPSAVKKGIDVLKEKEDEQ